MEQEIPDYDMDSEDEAWLNEQAKKMEITPLKFEEMLDRLEKGSGQQVLFFFFFFFFFTLSLKHVIVKVGFNISILLEGSNAMFQKLDLKMHFLKNCCFSSRKAFSKFLLSI